jgi:hypothetical protein
MAMSKPDKGQVMPWSAVFRQSKLSRYLWVVDDEWSPRVWEAVNGAGIPALRHSSMYNNLYDSSALLDGVVIYLDTYGFQAGMQSGTRVIGPWVLRWLCGVLGLRPPMRKLASEDHIPTFEELQSLLREQLRDPSALREKAKIGLFISDRESLYSAVRSLFGESAAPPPEVNPADPADGTLGEAGFTLRDAERVSAAGMSASDALAWRHEGISAWDIGQLAGRSLEGVLAWRALGIENMVHVRELLDAQVPLDTGRQLVDAGCPPDSISALATAKVPLEDCEVWSRSGLGGYCIRDLVGRNVPASHAKRWAGLSVGYTHYWLFFLDAGGTVAEAEVFDRAGVPVADWAGWVATTIEMDERLRWASLGVPPETARQLWEAGVGVEDTARHWHKGTRHKPQTIIGAVQQARLRQGIRTS